MSFTKTSFLGLALALIHLKVAAEAYKADVQFRYLQESNPLKLLPEDEVGGGSLFLGLRGESHWKYGQIQAEVTNVTFDKKALSDNGSMLTLSPTVLLYHPIFADTALAYTSLGHQRLLGRTTAIDGSSAGREWQAQTTSWMLGLSRPQSFESFEITWRLESVADITTYQQEKQDEFLMLYSDDNKSIEFRGGFELATKGPASGALFLSQKKQDWKTKTARFSEGTRSTLLPTEEVTQQKLASQLEYSADGFTLRLAGTFQRDRDLNFEALSGDVRAIDLRLELPAAFGLGWELKHSKTTKNFDTFRSGSPTALSPSEKRSDADSLLSLKIKYQWSKWQAQFILQNESHDSNYLDGIYENRQAGVALLKIFE